MSTPGATQALVAPTVPPLDPSAFRAALWKEEARLERASQKSDLWYSPGCDASYGKSYDKQCAQNGLLLPPRSFLVLNRSLPPSAFRRFVRVRFHKFHRARARRYARLKYLYELQHPPFATVISRVSGIGLFHAFFAFSGLSEVHPQGLFRTIILT
ncbi:hypothetical protein C8R47DRAFT_1229671 [Mycena vitilis]|nr:hypothetical protein C8R47DRAFT_1229671 [Mycena vitilis]